MTTAQEIPVEERFGALLDHLGIERAHFVASWRSTGLVSSLDSARPGSIASLTLVEPQATAPGTLERHAEHLLVFAGTPRDPQSASEFETLARSPSARVVDFPDGYSSLLWSDIAVDQGALIESELTSLIQAVEGNVATAAISPELAHGSVRGITYQTSGEGVPVIMLPVGLAPSQWDPLLPGLSREFCVITVGGRHIGASAFQYRRMATKAYGQVVDTLFDHLRLEPGMSILEVGVGTGAVAIRLAERTGRSNPVTGVDVNEYVVREAQQIIDEDGLGGVIRVETGDAESLPFEDGFFDRVFSATVMAEVDAELMMAELVRVCKPGGRIGALVGASDLPWVWGVDLPEALAAKVNAPRPGGVAERGVADRGLYGLFVRAGLTDLDVLPVWGTDHPPDAMWPSGPGLSAEEAEAFRSALAEGAAEGTAFVRIPFHCAAGTKRHAL